MITPESLAASGTEGGAQAALFCWAQQNILQYPQLKWLFHIPNGGFRDKITAAKLKAQGVKAGVPDICLPVKKYLYHEFTYCGLYIELKVGKNKATKEQEEWLAHLFEQGYDVAVCHGWEEARDKILKYLGV